MGIFRWVLGGLCGAAAGVVVWVLVGYFAHREVGWIAWVVGFLAGLGVRYAAHLGGGDASLGKGILATVIAVAAIFTAKFLVFLLIVAGTAKDREAVRDFANGMLKEDCPAIATIARDIAAQATKRGETVAWPPGVSATTASKESDFPPRIWSDALLRWLDSGTPQEKEQKGKRFAASLRLSDLTREPDFGDSFSPFDLLWFGLAIITAFKVGVGSYGDD
jgi:hypothetical protein